MTNNGAAKRLTAGDTTFYQFDPQLGFWGVPYMENLASFEGLATDGPILIRHNSEGNRDVEVDLEKSEKSIACFGGSHTWGVGVEQTDRYTERLAKLSGRRVMNLGHCSLGLDQVCLAILQKSRKYNPDIIIVEQYPWSVHRVLSPYVNGYIRPFFYLDSNQKLKLKKVAGFAKYEMGRRLVGSYYAFRKEFQEFMAGIDISSDYDPLSDPIFLYWKNWHYNNMYSLIGKILGVMRDHCNQKGIKLIFALGAIKQQFGNGSISELVDFDLPQNRLKELLENKSISYVDMKDQMLAEHTDQDPVIFGDGHINARGHDVFARMLHEKIHSMGWLQ